VILEGEEAEQNHGRRRHDVRLEGRCSNLEALDSTEDGNYRSDGPVAIKEGRTEQPDHHQDVPPHAMGSAMPPAR
jgi:hypothetical protein